MKSLQLCLWLQFMSIMMTTTIAIKMEIIPPASPESPYYMTNIRSSSSHLKSYQIEGHNAVKILIGTKFNQYYLALDASSDRIWLQCIECWSRPNHCIDHDPHFNPFICRESNSCSRFVCNSTVNICTHGENCNNALCRYHIRYPDESQTSMYIANETFRLFEANNGMTLIKKEVKFGCGINQINFKFGSEHNKLTGFMGMSWTGAGGGLPRQLGGRQSVFSHCLPSQLSKHSLLTFGDHVLHQTGGLNTIPLVTDERHPGYWVHLTGIDIQGFGMINLKKSSLALIDFGVQMTVLHTQTYDMIKNRLVGRFKRDPNLQPHRYKGLLCYQRNVPVKNTLHNLPNITSFLGGKPFEIHAQAAFFAYPQYFCLAIKAGPITKIGARALTNHMIIYDPMKRKLHFRPQLC